MKNKETSNEHFNNKTARRAYGRERAERLNPPQWVREIFDFQALAEHFEIRKKVSIIKNNKKIPIKNWEIKNRKSQRKF